MKTRWIRTESGLYMEIIDPEYHFDEVLAGHNLTDDEMVRAMRNYIEKRYGKDSSEAETYDIVNDPDTMAAIEEAKSELD